MKNFLLLAGTLACATAVAVAAEPSPTAETKPAEDKAICRNISEVGSRLNRRRICATRAQWEEMDRQNRLAIDRVQSGRQTSGN